MGPAVGCCNIRPAALGNAALAARGCLEYGRLDQVGTYGGPRPCGYARVTTAAPDRPRCLI